MEKFAKLRDAFLFFYFCALVASFLYTREYYMTYNIEIGSYLNYQDIIFDKLAKISWYVFIATLLVLIYSMSYRWFLLKWYKLQRSPFFKKYRFFIYLISGLFLLCLCYTLFGVTSETKHQTLFILIPALILLFIVLYFKLGFWFKVWKYETFQLLKIDDIVIFTLVIIISCIFFPIFIGHYEAYHLPRKDADIVFTSCDTFSTSGIISKKCIGKTSQYIFIYDNNTTVTTAYNINSIQSFKIYHTITPAELNELKRDPLYSLEFDTLTGLRLERL